MEYAGRWAGINTALSFGAATSNLPDQNGTGSGFVPVSGADSRFTDGSTLLDVSIATCGTDNLSVGSREAPRTANEWLVYLYRNGQNRTASAMAGLFKTVAAVFAIPSDNQPPKVATPIPDRRAAIGAAFQYTFAASTFSDPDGDVLTYTATLSDGNALPVWLSFNRTTRTFNGTPPSDSTSTFAIQVTASDGQATASDVFNLAVSNPTGPTELITWSTEAAPHPYRVSEGQGVPLNGKLYVFGGFDIQKNCCTPTDRVYVFDPTANTWTRLAPMPAMNNTGRGGVTHSGFATDGTDIYFAGGYTSNSAGTGQLYGTKEVWKYTVATNTYTRLPDLPNIRSAGQLEYLNGRLHYIGGTNVTRTSDVGGHYVLSLDDLATGWTTLATVPNPRHHAGSVVHNGKIYYIGGQHGHDQALVTEDDVHAYDPATNTWALVAIMPRPRGHIAEATFVWGDQIFILGGEIAHGNHVKDAVAYNPVTNKWTTFTSFPVTRSSGVAYHVNGVIYYTTGSWSSLTYKGIVSPAPVQELSFSPNVLHYTVAQGLSVTPQSTRLSATDGTPAITLTKSTGTDWLTLPAAALDSLTVGPVQINTDNLTPGNYSALVTATATGYTSSTLQINLTVTEPPVPTVNLKVNFQDAATAQVPADFIKDAGLPYGERGNGYTYGWVTQSSLATNSHVPMDFSADARNRKRVGISLEQNTFMHIQLTDAFPTRANQERGAWEIAVPNGTYQVTAMVGDQAYDSRNRINVEGAVLINNFRGSASKAYEQKSGQFNVTDGALTIDAVGGYNTKINSVYVQSVNVEEPTSILALNTQNLPGQVNRLQAYPNPVLDYVNIDFTAPVTGSVKLNLYNASGEEIAAVYEGEAEAEKTYTFTYRVGSLKKGVYYLNLSTDKTFHTTKLVIR